MTELRPYQVEVVEEFWSTVAAGRRRIMIVAPTAAGKTVIGAATIKTATAEHKGSALVLAHRREIVTQTTGSGTASSWPILTSARWSASR